MKLISWVSILIVITFFGCENSSSDFTDKKNPSQAAPGAGLLLSQYKSLDELKSVITISYLNDSTSVRLSSIYHNEEVVNDLEPGVSQDDLSKAAKGNFWDKLWICMKCPFVITHKNALTSIENLGRRKNEVFGHADVAFYDLADAMVQHISDEDKMYLSEKELSDKGYLNSFDHIISQTFMTSIFSEPVADFVGDAHELSTMPELLTGKFSDEEITDVDLGPTDNYLDLINNEWGQKLGVELQKKYCINKNTFWSPELLANYLNDIQSYNTWVFKIAFKPFTSDDELIIRFSEKLNKVI